MRRIATTIAVVTAVTTVAMAGAAPALAAHKTATAHTYYLSLGDSLAQGVQPNSSGASVETNEGYANQLYTALHSSNPTLKLVKLGCPGETTTTMINGGVCRYPGGSQLAGAEAFLRDHRDQGAGQAGQSQGRVLLVTIDIGANDPEQCGAQPGLTQLARCAVKDIPSAAARLSTIMTRLTAAAGPGVRIVGMTYYLPALAEWHDGLPGQLIARTAERLAAVYNRLLSNVYTSSGARVANVFGAFETADFTAGPQDVPRNVARLCQWTWACAAPPRGPNQHANQAGYQVIARTFLQAAGLN